VKEGGLLGRVLVVARPVLILAPTIWMAIWGRHHLPAWVRKLPCLFDWGCEFGHQLGAVFLVFGLTMFFLLGVEGVLSLTRWLRRKGGG
jgi:hypothetical protein